MTSTDKLAAILPGYEIGAELGRGGYGVVLAGRHRQLGRAVAIKELPPKLAADAGVRARFVAEARVLAALDHPHIVPVYDFVEQDGVCALVMEALPGGTVWGRFNAVGYTPGQACAVSMVACTGLHHAHQHGVLHRDVKPENLLLTEAGQLKVADFGIAKVLGDNDALATTSGEILGTPAYIAPEQAEGGELGPPADVYAAGVMLYELLAGRLPFSEDGGALAIVYRHVYEQPDRLHDVAPAVPTPVADVVMRALARDPAARYASAEELGVAIGDAAGSAWGAGWFEAAGVPVLAGGPILASTQSLTSPPSLYDGAVNSSDPRPAAATIVVRAQTQVHVQGSAADASPESVVPVRQVLVNPPRPVLWAALTAGLLAVLAVLALTPPSGENPQRGAVQLNGRDAATRPAVDLAAPFTLSGPRTADHVTLDLSVAGVQLASASTGPVTAGSVMVDARGSRYLAAGTVRGTATFSRNGKPLTTTVFPLRIKRFPLATVPGAAAVLALLIALAYGESQLAPLRRRGRRRLASFFGLAITGAVLGGLAAVFEWLFGDQPLVASALLRCAVVGAAAGLLLGVTSYKQGRRSRLRRIARKQGLTPR